MVYYYAGWVSIVIKLLAAPLVLAQVGPLKVFNAKSVESRKLEKDNISPNKTTRSASTRTVRTLWWSERWPYVLVQSALNRHRHCNGHSKIYLSCIQLKFTNKIFHLVLIKYSQFTF